VIILETPVEDADEAELVRFARKTRKLAGLSGEVAILVTGNRRLQELNRRFRKKNRPTDVLSFPRDGGGDIAISAPLAAENAALYGHNPADELKILILHGMLHLAGYDHETDAGEMASREARLRAMLKLPASLTERAARPSRGNPSRGK